MSSSGALATDLSDRLGSASAVADESSRPYDYQLKLLTLGDMGVGKTSIVLRYVRRAFNSALLSTIGVDFIVKVITVENVRLRLQIWDTAGQERFRSLAGSYTRGADGVLVVYDVTQANTFASAESWLRSELGSPTQPAVRVLVANKCDDEARRCVPTAQGQALADSLGVRYFETSAKTGSSVEDIFTYLAYELKRLRQINAPGSGAGSPAAAAATSAKTVDLSAPAQPANGGKPSSSMCSCG